MIIIDYDVAQSVRTDHDQPWSPTEATQVFSELDSPLNDSGKSTCMKAACLYIYTALAIM